MYLKNSVFDRLEDKPNVLCIGSAREVTEDLFIVIRIQIDIHFQNELSGGDWVARRAVIFRKVVDQMRELYLLVKQILFVEKQNDRSLDEVVAGRDDLKQSLRLFHSVFDRILIALEECLVVLIESGQEYDGSDVLKAVDPFATLRPNVKLSSQIIGLVRH